MDIWQSLRQEAIQTGVGQTFRNVLLDTSAGQAVPLDNGCKLLQGGDLFFDDSPEVVSGSVMLDGGQTLQQAGFNGVLFTDTQSLVPGVRYRFFVHHVNSTGATRRISVRAANHGPSNSALLQKTFEHVAVGQVVAAAEQLSKAFLNPIVGGSNTFSNPDTLPGSAFIGAPSIPQFGNSTGNLVDLVSKNVPIGQLMTGIIDFTVQDPGVRVYSVVGNPPASAYLNDNLTALQQDIHGRGTFPEKVVTRFVPAPFQIDTGTETPGVFWLVNRNEGTPPDDTAWTGNDRCLAAAQPGQNAGNYGRLHLIEIGFVSNAAAGRSVAIVANPRSPGSSFFGYVRDVGAVRNVRVPAAGTVAVGTNDSGTVIWKGPITQAATVVKRLVYSTAGASAGKLNLWVIPL